LSLYYFGVISTCIAYYFPQNSFAPVPTSLQGMRAASALIGLIWQEIDLFITRFFVIFFLRLFCFLSQSIADKNARFVQIYASQFA